SSAMGSVRRATSRSWRVSTIRSGHRSAMSAENVGKTKMGEVMQSRSSTARRSTVLVVDDEAPLMAIERRILEQAGYQVLEAADGDEGIARMAGDTVVHLLIVDLHMPV